MMCDAERSSTKGPIAERSKCPKVTPQKKKKKTQIMLWTQNFHNKA